MQSLPKVTISLRMRTQLAPLRVSFEDWRPLILIMIVIWISYATGGVDSAYEVTVWKNDGDPFNESWAHQHVGSPENQVYRVVASDLDDDGWLDIVTSGNYDNNYEIMSWRNDGTPFSDSWQRQNIGITADNCSQIQVGDLDRDGDDDIVGGCSWREDYKVIGWENDGTPFDGQLWPAHNLGTFHCGPYSLELKDLDGDGWLDIAAGGDFCDGPEGIFIWRNDHTPFGDLWERTEVGACTPKANVNAVVAADIDNDNDLDLVTGCSPAEDYEIIVWENDGSPFDDPWIQHDVGSHIDRVWPVATADLNSDGYPEIVSGTYRGEGYELAIWLNTGEPFDGLWPRQDIAQSDSDLLAIALADMDDDGNIDIVTGSNTLDLRKKLPGSGPPVAERIVYDSQGHENPSQIYIAYPNGSGARRLTDADTASVHGKLSPDGTKILFTPWVGHRS